MGETSFSQSRYNVFSRQATCCFEVSICDLFEKRFNQTDCERRLIDLLSSVMSDNYECFQRCSALWHLSVFRVTSRTIRAFASFLQGTFAAAGPSIEYHSLHIL
jgi:hypothetical protein